MMNVSKDTLIAATRPFMKEEIMDNLERYFRNARVNDNMHSFGPSANELMYANIIYSILRLHRPKKSGKFCSCGEERPCKTLTIINKGLGFSYA